MNIDIVIPSYNGAELLKKNLPILIKEAKKYDVDNIIIVNDGSGKEDSEKLVKLIENLESKTKIKLKLLNNDKNLGFSSTVNNGVAASNAELVLLLNTDVIVEPNFLDAALNDMKRDENLFGVGLMDKSVEKDGVVLRGRGLAYWSRGFIHHARGEVDREDTFWISGGSSIIRRELFNKLSGFDPLYNPFYWEDIDLSYRARKAGYKIMFERNSSVEHRHDEGAIKKHFKPTKVKVTAYRNQFTFIWKNITDTSLIINHLIWLPYYFIKAIFNLDSPFFMGFWQALIRLPNIIKKKYAQKKYFVNSDKDILSG